MCVAIQKCFVGQQVLRKQGPTVAKDIPSTPRAVARGFRKSHVSLLLRISSPMLAHSHTNNTSAPVTRSVGVRRLRHLLGSPGGRKPPHHDAAVHHRRPAGGDAPGPAAAARRPPGAGGCCDRQFRPAGDALPKLGVPWGGGGGDVWWACNEGVDDPRAVSSFEFIRF